MSGLLLAAMAPAALEVSLQAAEQAQKRCTEVDLIWPASGTRGLCRRPAWRQYQLAEPENRLVVRELEKDWEHALAERRQFGEEYDRNAAVRPRVLTRRRARSDPGPGRRPPTADPDQDPRPSCGHRRADVPAPVVPRWPLTRPHPYGLSSRSPEPSARPPGYTMPQDPGLGPHQQLSLPLVEMRKQHSELQAELATDLFGDADITTTSRTTRSNTLILCEPLRAVPLPALCIAAFGCHHMRSSG